MAENGKSVEMPYADPNVRNKHRRRKYRELHGDKNLVSFPDGYVYYGVECGKEYLDRRWGLEGRNKLCGDCRIGA